MVNTELLNKIIDESGLKRQFLADQIGISRFALNKKIYGENEFKASEVLKLSELLDITMEQRERVFFDL